MKLPSSPLSSVGGCCVVEKAVPFGLIERLLGIVGTGMVSSFHTKSKTSYKACLERRMYFITEQRVKLSSLRKIMRFVGK